MTASCPSKCSFCSRKHRRPANLLWPCNSQFHESPSLACQLPVQIPPLVEATGRVVICWKEGSSTKRLTVDTAAPAVKKFIRSLAKDTNGVEVTLGGKVICRVIPPAQLSDAEKAAPLDEVRKMLGHSRHHSKRLPGTVIERKIRQGRCSLTANDTSPPTSC